MTRRVVLCADDFGWSPQTSRAIADLARDGRVQAVSAMTVMPGWRRDSVLLADRAPGVEVGLHLTLCDEVPLGPMPRAAPDGRMLGKGAMERAALTGRLALDDYAAEIDRQFAAFVAAMGHPPEFVDAHKHTHLLPGLRGVMLDAVARHAPNAWVRNCADRTLAILARPFRWKALGSALWSIGFRAAARRQGLRTNDSFAGHYNYRGGFDRLLPAFTRAPGPFHLVMVHPGGDDRAGDDIADARVVERRILAG